VTTIVIDEEPPAKLAALPVAEAQARAREQQAVEEEEDEMEEEIEQPRRRRRPPQQLITEEPRSAQPSREAEREPQWKRAQAKTKTKTKPRRRHPLSQSDRQAYAPASIAQTCFACWPGSSRHALRTGW
jgi:hypothetical protein